MKWKRLYLPLAIVLAGFSTSRADLYESEQASWFGQWTGEVPQVLDKAEGLIHSSAATSMLQGVENVAQISSLLEDRRVHGTYSPSHRATLVSWAAFFDRINPGDIPSTGNGLDESRRRRQEGEKPGGHVGPNIPPVPAPKSAGLAALGFGMVFYLSRYWNGAR